VFLRCDVVSVVAGGCRGGNAEGAGPGVVVAEKVGVTIARGENISPPLYSGPRRGYAPSARRSPSWPDTPRL
jgi:hypothetical protein